jgi:hypothetical protein
LLTALSRVDDTVVEILLISRMTAPFVKGYKLEPKQWYYNKQRCSLKFKYATIAYNIIVPDTVK